MDFTLTEEQRMLKQLAHDLAVKEFPPMAYWEKLAEKETYFPEQEEYVMKLVKAGLLGINMPIEYGGQGREAIEAILVVEELARVCLPAAHCVFEGSVGPIIIIEQYGSDELKSKYIPRVCKGQLLVAAGMTEPEAGSALTDLKTKAVLSGDNYVVNGQKRFVTGGGHNGAYLTWVRLSDKQGHQGIGGLVIEAGTPGFTFGKQERHMGHRYVPNCDLIFDNVRVPKGNLVVKEGGFRQLMTAFDIERCGNATMCLGICQGALDDALKYVQERKQFGKEICEFQAVQFMLADMAIKTEAARWLIYRAVHNAGKGLPSPLESSMAKCFTNEIAREVTSLGAQIFGGYGFSSEYPQELRMRDAWGWGVAGGTIQIQKVTIASRLLGKKFNQRK